jgi:2-methylcitrate dehydratase PrpD
MVTTDRLSARRGGIRELVDLICALTAERVSQPAKAEASRCMLDTVVGAVGGLEIDAARAARSWVLADFGGGRASVWWSGTRRPVAAAAFANSASASALDVDDGHPAAPGHPGAGIVPAVVAAAEAVAASRDELLAALAIGYEVAIRVGAARRIEDSGTSGHWCGQGAAAAIGWLRGVSREHLAHALAITTAQRPLVLVNDGPPNNANGIKEGIPWATFVGATAVELALAGMSGPLDALDDQMYDQRLLLDGWGDRYYIETITRKPYACCRWFHPAIDGLLDLQATHGVQPADILSVRVATFHDATAQHNQEDPRSPEEAQYSLPFCLAVAAHHGGSGLLPLEHAMLGDGQLVEFARRVRWVVDPSLEAAYREDRANRGATVTLETTRGTFEHRVDAAQGAVEYPMREPAITFKLEALAAGTLRPDQQQRLIERLLGDETDARQIGDVLRPPCS